jgi:hypothetical protein
LGLLGCSGDSPKELVLFDFETDAELDHLHWQCFTLYSLSDEHISHGGRSLKLELYPSNWPGLTPKLAVRDWRGFKAVRLDVYNPSLKDVQITVRIDDRKDYPDYADRYNKAFILLPGLNNLSIPLDKLVTSGTRRNLDLKKIYKKPHI